MRSHSIDLALLGATLVTRNRFIIQCKERASQALVCFTLLTWSGCEDAGEPLGASFPAPTPSYSGFVDPISSPPHAQFSSDEFRPAEQCASCHPQHFEEWSHSSHASAMTDPVFLALVARQRDVLGTKLDRFCTQCHSTIGTRSGEIQGGFEVSDLAAVIQQGVTCDGCHRITHVARANNAGHQLAADAPVQGPFESALGASHPTKRNALFENSEFCGSCHDAVAGGLSLESPYEEWRNSPAAQRGVHCQGCHMPTYSGKAALQPDVTERPTLHRHTFTGVEVPWDLPDGPKRDALEEAAKNLLSSGVALEVRSTRRENHKIYAELEVRSLLDGHRLPTGSSFFRQCWLAFEVRDADGAIVFQSGHLDPAGDLFDDLHPQHEQEDPYLVMFGATLRDEEGNPVLFPFEAASRQERGLAPLEQRAVTYAFDVPSDAAFPLRIEALVRFRPQAPRLLRAIGLSVLVPRLRVTNMARVSATIDPQSTASTH